MLKKGLKIFVLTLLAYLLQATAAVHMAIADVAPNPAMAIIAVATVCLGRKYTFVMSLAVGYLLEIMMPTIEYFHILLYPVCCMLAALFFADKSERRLEEERTTGRYHRQLNPHLRTPLAAALSVAVYEGVHLTYLYLGGVTLDSGHISRAVIDVVYTMALAGLLQFPIRKWLGVYRLRHAQ
ncbi:MAG TPA: hypothetical protein IAC48_02230 [Candidatus Limiplasma stercoravium]|nr:hypothetical protein [Candidatus Limiplasma stercoravium]